MSSGLPDFPQTIPPDTLLGRTGINAGPVQALPFSTLASIFPPPPTPPASVAIYKNFVTDFGGVGDGVTNNQGAFTAFAAYALPLQVPNPTPIVLAFPPGTYFNNPAVSGKSDAGAFFEGIPNLTLLGYGAAITGTFGVDHPAIITGILGAYSWRIQATNVGDTQFTVLLANTAMTFAAGNLQCTNAQGFSSGGGAFAQSINSYTTGKFYFEATITALTGVGAKSLGVGWSNGYGPINPQGSTIVGTKSFMIFDDGTIWQDFPGNGTQVGSLGASFANGNVIGCAIDITNQLGWFRINNGNWNGSGAANPATGVGGLALSFFSAPYQGWQLTPAFVCTFISANPGSVTHNFGGSGYAFTRPSGFGDWSNTLNPNYPMNIQPNDWVLICSADAQDVSNYPPNWQFMEWHQVLTVNATTGVCTITQPNMQYAHSATLPDISVTRNQFQDHGGPASVFLLSPTANPLTGLTNNSPITGGTPGAGPNGPNRMQPWVAGITIYGMHLPNDCHIQNARYVDCSFTGQIAPSGQQRAIFERCILEQGSEIDKLVTQLDFIDCEFGSTEVGLSSSIEQATFNGCSFHDLNAVFKQAIYRDCKIQKMNIGATYAQNQTLTVENCIIGKIVAGAGGPQLNLSDTSFANGAFTLNLDVITHNTMSNYWRFTIPGVVGTFSANGSPLSTPFTITSSNLIRTGGILTGTIAGGSAYTNGTYNYVPLTGGAGFQTLANIVVSGGAVTSVTFVNEGLHYSVSDVLTTAAANIGGTGSGFTFTVNTVSANNIVQIFTTLAALPTYSGVTADAVVLLVAPSVMFNNNLGNGQAIALSQGQDGLPAFSYYYLELNGSNLLGADNANTTQVPVIGSAGYVIKMRVNVRKAYTGAQNPMVLHVLGLAGRFSLSQSGNTWTQIRPDIQIDLKVAGERIITANRVSGLQPNDINNDISAAPQPWGQTWFRSNTFQPALGAPINGDTQDKWPVVDIEIITDQGMGTFSNTGTIDYLQESGWHVVATTYTAQIGEKIAANTTGGAFTLTLPPSPAIGDFVKAYDAGTIFGTNNLTIGRNGNNINSAAANFVASTNGQVLELVFISASIGWRVFT